MYLGCRHSDENDEEVLILIIATSNSEDKEYYLGCCEAMSLQEQVIQNFFCLNENGMPDDKSAYVSAMNERARITIYWTTITATFYTFQVGTIFWLLLD